MSGGVGMMMDPKKIAEEEAKMLVLIVEELKIEAYLLERKAIKRIKQMRKKLIEYEDVEEFQLQVQMQFEKLKEDYLKKYNMNVFEFEILIKNAEKNNDPVFKTYELIYSALTSIFESKKLMPRIELQLDQI
mmetsp:Transcript_18784/g.13611  ORF Transcript_18784/g.13611 Transcript_18784/m.13611 type:complete len:132 (+) Transcript_18784:144-539(+)